MAIRYDKKTNREINRVIRNFNNKVSRLTKLESDYILPQKITSKELKSGVYTRRELNRKLNELKRFSKKGAEETVITPGGYAISRYELENLKKETSRVKADLTRQLKKLRESEPTVYGKKQGFTFAQMGDSLYLNIQAKRNYLNKNLLNISKENIESYKTMVSKLGRSKELLNIIFQDNMDEMIATLAYRTGIDKEKADLLKEKFSQLTPENFYKLFQNEKSIKSIIEQYDIVTGRIGKVDPDIIKEDANDLYDNLINNIDDIIKDYL